MLDKTIKRAHSVDAAIRNSDMLHSTITEKLQEYTNLKHGLTSIWQPNAQLQNLSVFSNKLPDHKKLLIKICVFIFSTVLSEIFLIE
jgi:hypothetical protein